MSALWRNEIGKGVDRVKDDEIEVNVLYADNEPFLVEVRFEIPGERWSEFEKSPVYLQLKDYVHSLQTQGKQTGRNGLECTKGSGASLPHSNPLGYYESFLAQVRRLFRKRRFRL